MQILTILGTKFLAGVKISFLTFIRTEDLLNCCSLLFAAVLGPR